jgi:HK97 family phage prohead protease
MNRIIVPFLELKSGLATPKDSQTEGFIAGYGSTFGNVDDGGDICVKGCFMSSLLEHKDRGTMPFMFWDHKMSPVGEWRHIEETDKGLKCEGDIWTGKGIEDAEKARMVAKSNTRRGLSIGYKTREYNIDKKSGARNLTRLDVEEISVVMFPMNRSAIIEQIKSFSGELPTIRECETLLRDAGLSHKQTKALLAKGYDGLRDEDSSSQEEIAAMLQGLHQSITNSIA